MLRRIGFLDLYESSGLFVRSSLWGSSPGSIGRHAPWHRVSHIPDIPEWWGRIFHRSRLFMEKKSVFSLLPISNLEWELRLCSAARDYRLRSVIFFAHTMFTHKLW